MSDTAAKLVPSKSDFDLATEYKARILEAYKPIVALFEEIDKAGFQANVQATKGPLGNFAISQLSIVKVY